VVGGDTLPAIAGRFGTTARSIAYWNRVTHPSLDPESPTYEPDRIEIGWTLGLIPGIEVDEQELPTLIPTALPSVSIAPGPTSPADGTSLLVSHGSRESNAVALTFDMGGRLDPALSIMDWLVAHDVRATIFPTGNAASETSVGREVLARIAAHPELFAVGNHSWDHPDFRELSAAEIAYQLERTEAALSPLFGSTTKPFFRPPYGSHDDTVRNAVGAAGWRLMVMWDVDTIDWRASTDGGPSADDIVAKVISRARGGSIVLMHVGGWNTLEALPRIVDGLRARGLEPVTLTELLRN
jgi:peptidoglycan/xylan/chitin deacetylase (PgdA/CDA1 family)